MNSDPRAANNDLVLAPGEFAYMQSTTNGDVRTNVGPSVVTQAGNDRPVKYNNTTRTFERCSLEAAVQSCVVANEGDYIVLENPANENKHPSPGANSSPVLNSGRKVMIPGPAVFALYPGQSADVIPGHQLRSNQYLLCRIYNEEEARANWNKMVVKTLIGDAGQKPKTGGTDQEIQITTDTTALTGEVTAVVTEDVTATNLIQGQLFTIKGTDVSFYIPPTGVEVIADVTGEYVRNAVTLEQLEYAILIDENGNKRYEKGPQVVFPKPTERFHERDIEEDGEIKKTRRFRAIELNNIQGLHLKVIAPFQETINDKKIERKVGDEYFITGKEQAIFYPRPELSIVTYGEGNQKHYATAVPAGEARYVMNRDTGEIATVDGPTMLLPNPIHEVQVRRILSDNQVSLWYPNNGDALVYNQQLRQLSATAPRGRSSMITEAEFARQASNALTESRRLVSEDDAIGASDHLARNAISRRSLAEPTRQTRAAQAQAETFNRGTQYSPPRQVTIDSRFEGAPSISVWTGYAVLVVSKTGKRRVEVGPTNVILNYDETLEVLSLSTGKPKNTDKLQDTVYLRVKNNKVSDYISVETSDHVTLEVRLSYRVNFEGSTQVQKEAWFCVENYVKFLCDHARSVLKGAVRKTTIEKFYSDSTDIVRNSIIGEPAEGGERPGMRFEENGMVVTDVEVLGVEIKDAAVRELLSKAQGNVIKQNIAVGEARKNLEVTKENEEIAREIAEAQAETAERRATLARDQINRELTTNLSAYEADLRRQAEAKKVAVMKEDIQDVSVKAQLSRDKLIANQTGEIESARLERRIKEINAEVEAAVKRYEAITPGFTQALLALSNNETLEKVSRALSVQVMLGGGDLVDVLKKTFGEKEGLGGMVQNLIDGVNRDVKIPLNRETTMVPSSVR